MNHKISIGIEKKQNWRLFYIGQYIVIISIIIGHKFTFVHNLVHMKTLKFICKSILRKKVNLLKEWKRFRRARTMEKPPLRSYIGYTLGSRKFKHRSSSMANKTHSPSFLFTVAHQCRILFWTFVTFYLMFWFGWSAQFEENWNPRFFSSNPWLFTKTRERSTKMSNLILSCLFV